MYEDIVIKCQIEGHDNNVKLVCFDETCKGNRLYCLQCNRNGIHCSHPQHQYELSMLFEHIEKVDKECDHLNNRLKQFMDSIYQSFNSLILGIKNKYQRSKEQFLKLNSNQMNSLYTETLLFKSFESKIEIQMAQSSKDFQDSLKYIIQELKLYIIFISQLFIIFTITQLNYYQISDSDIKKSEELYTKGYNQKISLMNLIIYLDDNNYEEAIKIMDEALIFNFKHQQALYCKASCLINNYEYNLLYGSLINLMKQLYGQINPQKLILNINYHFGPKRKVYLIIMNIIYYKDA